MKIEPVGTSLVRYFRGPATSAWGKITRTPVVAVIQFIGPIATIFGIIAVLCLIGAIVSAFS